ncbi:MAG: ABC transporter substrate-binding protein [Gammaproteobacteria bacterium]|nr:ABC transporter substrate-binding protein [Gammaproteobacteria bacterium]NIR81624.1 ABC transporter substrate-binding protein [Gammaproteobacteria bacterium]NIR88175.1 ABC transporter substrate-binding protein [Gammaproteobacteria bacterium]NIU02736.1 ABC transporter substrate-binding protein [Gammaproteobacteria bacterium]NIV73335.1 extracellular solute-binding protein [Gammaproteobacteria bacterium]
MRAATKYAAALAALLIAATAAQADSGAPELTVVSWGGAYEAAQCEAWFQPFTERTGIPVRVERYDGGLEGLREQVASGDVRWDLMDMTMSDTLAACREGLLMPLDHGRWPPAPDGTPAERDFIDGAFTRCGVTHTIYATVIAFDRRAFPGVRPDSVEALFDTERFPGRRALQRTPAANLEWALLSYGVPRQEVYDLLSTERGLKLAFERLSRIAGDIVWWQEGSQAPDLLAEGEVSMASGYNGRFFHAAVTEGAPIEIIWDGQIQERETWAIPRGAPHREAAVQFIRFATTSERLAELARRIPYGPARRSATRRVSTHIGTGIDMRPHLPTHPINARYAVRKDVDWYARTYHRIRDRFRRWLGARD